MFSDTYDVGPIRPPSEAGSLLIRVSRNCPWNKCEFCHVYKETKFEKKSLDEIKKDIDAAAQLYGSGVSSISTAFLQDANAILMKTSELIEVIIYLKSRFPAVSRITTYGRAQTVARKTVSELKELKDAGLSRLHMGLESGYGPLLDYIRKGCSPEELIVSGRKVMDAGISLSEYIMPGLGGKAMSEGHAVETARVLNAIDPDFIRVRSCRVIPGTPLDEKTRRGEFIPLSDFETVEELRLLISNLEGITSEIVSDHILNLLQEVRGTLPKDKERMLAAMDDFLALPIHEKELFQVGTRLGWFGDLEDMRDNARRRRVEGILSGIREEIAAQGGGFTIDDVLREALKDRI